ncbi:MAG: transporter substrate-binding domain-containing protein [Thermoanaerobaculia bacterium]|nr:transporter substrate-binding domain-containing protein [Thermoanaerobaculia bacterium]
MSLAALVLLATLAAPASENRPEELLCYSTIFEPFVIQGEDRIHGADVELIEEIGRRLDLTIKIELRPWRRIEASLRNGAPDLQCAFAFFDTEERRTYMSFMQVPLHVTDYVLFAHRSSVDRFAGGALPSGAIVAVNRGFHLPQVIESAAARGEIVLHEVGEEEQSLRMLALDRVDAVLTHRGVGEHVLRRLDLEGLVALEPAMASRPAYLVFPNESKLSPGNATIALGLGPRDLALRFDQALTAMQEDGTVAAILARHGLSR